MPMMPPPSAHADWAHPSAATHVPLPIPTHMSVPPPTSVRVPAHISATIPAVPIQALSTSNQTINPVLSLPMTLFVGSIPRGMSDEFILAILTQFGTVARWGRPTTASTTSDRDLDRDGNRDQASKPYGFVTYERGVDAWKCMQLLPVIDIHSGSVTDNVDLTSMLKPGIQTPHPVASLVSASLLSVEELPVGDNGVDTAVAVAANDNVGVTEVETAESNANVSDTESRSTGQNSDVIAGSRLPEFRLGQRGAHGYLVVKAGTRETAKFAAMVRSEAELASLEQTRGERQQQGQEQGVQLCVPALREQLHKVSQFIAQQGKHGPSHCRAGIDEIMSSGALISVGSAVVGGGVTEEEAEKDEDESQLTEEQREDRAREKLIRSQIEQFRAMQAVRDKELEHKRKHRLAARLQQLRAQERRAQELRRERDEAGAGAGADADAEVVVVAHVDDSAVGPSSKQEQDHDDEAARKRRKLQEEVMEFMSTSEALLSPEALLAASMAQEQEQVQTQEGQALTQTQVKAPMKVALKLTGLAPPKTTKQLLSSEYAGSYDAGEEQQQQMRELITIDYSEEELNQNRGLILQQQAGQVGVNGTSKDSMKAAAAAAAATAAAIASKIGGSVSSSASVTAPSAPSVAAAAASVSLKARSKAIIDSIPTGKDELFSAPVNWEKCVQYRIIETYIHPWLSKKMLEFLGEEEETLIQFILGKLNKKCHPNEILEEITQVLDEDAEPFVIKLWRMLIYNIKIKEFE